jgi:hypothetical protein
MPALNPEQLLLEVEEVIRSMPDPRDFSVNPQKVLPWMGRASAAMRAWDSGLSILHFEPLVQNYSRRSALNRSYNYDPTRQSLVLLLHQAQNALRLQSMGPLSIGIGTGRVFEYFDEVRKLIEGAKSDLLFVDPYIDAEFVSRYLPHVADGVITRILARERVLALKSAVAAFTAQTTRSINIRTAPNFHDRYLFVDGVTCHQSGASFKDGAKKAPTTLTQITDAFLAVQSTYEKIWDQATPA